METTRPALADRSATNQVGFIGLGDIGAPMAMRLFKRGADPLVFNRTPAKSAAFADEGARVAGSVVEIAATCDVIFTCLFDAAADKAVYLGPGGLLDSPASNRVFVNTSTIGPWVAQELAAAARSHGDFYLDSPLLGAGRIAAAAGQLILPVGGWGDVLERVRPILALVADTIAHVGEVGTAQVIKLAYNFTWALDAIALSESVDFALASGVDAEGLHTILSAQDERVSVARRYLDQMVHRRLVERSSMTTITKDLDAALAQAASVGRAPVLGSAAAEVYHAALDAGFGHYDMSCLVHLTRSTTGEHHGPDR